MENMENKKPENQKVFNVEAAKAKLRAMADNFAASIKENLFSVVNLGLSVAGFQQLHQ